MCLDTKKNIELKHDRHNHRYLFLIDGGVRKFETSVAKGKEILEFLKCLKGLK